MSSKNTNPAKTTAVAAAIAALLLASLACTININLPSTDVKTGPTVTDPIEVPLPDDPQAVTPVEINFGGGRLLLSPGATDALVSGEAEYNVPDFKPEVLISEDKVLIRQGDLEINGIPNFWGDIKNTWTLAFGDAPIDLTIKTGAYEGEMELGGLALNSLSIADGAAKNTLTFSDPNQVEMEALRYDTGASQVSLTRLGNANFSQMSFRSGAGDYTLDFSGELQRDADVEVRSGLSNIKIIVPPGTAARLTVEGGLNNVDPSGEWRSSGSVYTLEGAGPTLTITVEMGAGNLELRTR
jgi:hypothetical protein